MKILHIDDDSTAAAGVRLALIDHTVEHADGGAYGVELGTLYGYDLIICDVDMPGLDGFGVVKQLRDAKVETPILMLSGRTEVSDTVRALDAGADDFASKPCHTDELRARVAALVRRSRGISTSYIDFGDLRVDLSKKRVFWQDEPIHFTGKEYKMMETMALRRGVTITKEMFLDSLYRTGVDDEPELKIIDVFICKVRKKLRAATGHDDMVRTVWGRGYVLEMPAASATM